MSDILKKRYKVFVSSTYSDLREARKHVIQALLETKCIPTGMELFPAASDEKWTLITRVIDDCDYYIVIVAGKYGSCGSDDRSYTEMEFDYAVESGKHIVGFYHEDLDRLRGSKLEKSGKARERLEAFTAKVKERMCKSWQTPDALASAVKSAMLHEIEHHPQPGWIREGSAPDPRLVDELKQRIAHLEAKAKRPRAPRFAHGDVRIQMPLTVSFSVWRDAHKTDWDSHKQQLRLEVSLRAIFQVLAPRLSQKRSLSGLKRMLNNWLAKLLRDRLGQLSAAGPRPASVNADSDAFDQALQTFVASKMVKRVPPPSNVRTKGLYWQLTPNGVQHLAELQALPPDDEPDFSDLPRSVQDPDIQEGVRAMLVKELGRAPTKRELYEELSTTDVQKETGTLSEQDCTLLIAELEAEPEPPDDM